MKLAKGHSEDYPRSHRWQRRDGADRCECGARRCEGESHSGFSAVTYPCSLAARHGYRTCKRHAGTLAIPEHLTVEIGGQS